MSTFWHPEILPNEMVVVMKSDPDLPHFTIGLPIHDQNERRLIAMQLAAWLGGEEDPSWLDKLVPFGGGLKHPSGVIIGVDGPDRKKPDEDQKILQGILLQMLREKRVIDFEHLDALFWTDE